MNVRHAEGFWHGRREPCAEGQSGGARLLTLNSSSRQRRCVSTLLFLSVSVHGIVSLGRGVERERTAQGHITVRG
jgi:hypothetical protein